MSGKLSDFPKVGMPRKNTKQVKAEKQRLMVLLVIELERELAGVRIPAAAASIVNALYGLVK